MADNDENSTVESGSDQIGDIFNAIVPGAPTADEGE
jgi:hypothetical protein